MSKNGRGNQLVPCSHCNGTGWVRAQNPVRNGTKLIVNGREVPSNSTRFETSAAALAPSFGKFPPIEQQLAPIDQGALSPGESRRSTLYHQWSTGDVWVSGLIAIVSGSLVGLSSVPICIAAHVRWYWVPIIWTGTTTIVWVLKAWDFFKDDKAITHHQEQERIPEPAPIVQEPPAVEVVINSGHTQHRAKLRAPRSDYGGLWKYADALVRGTAAPSYGGSKNDGGLLGAKAFGYTPAEFAKWRPTAIQGGILEEDPHKSKGYRLTRAGRRAMARVAEHRLGEWG